MYREKWKMWRQEHESGKSENVETGTLLPQCIGVIIKRSCIYSLLVMRLAASAWFVVGKNYWFIILGPMLLVLLACEETAFSPPWGDASSSIPDNGCAATPSSSPGDSASLSTQDQKLDGCAAVQNASVGARSMDTVL